MSRSSWNIFYLQSGDTWVADSTIYRPNQDLTLGRVSTENSIQLADGSLGSVTLETKSTKPKLSFIWDYVDSTLKTKIETYIEYGTDLKITDHNTDSYYGRFTDIQSNWLIGQSGDYYDIMATFKQVATLEI